MIYFVVNKANVLIKTEGNNIKLMGAIYPGDDLVFEYYISKLETEYNDIKVWLHTEGGSVFAGNYIKNRIRSSKSTDDLTVIGTAFSMGAIILTGASKRKMVRNGFIMIHSASDNSGGTASELKETIKILESINKNFLADLMEITGKSKKEVLKWLEKDTYFNAEQALKVGLIQEIVEPFVELENIDAKNSYSEFTALLTASNKIDKKLKTSTMKLPIITALQLTSVNAESSDTAVINAVKAHYEARQTALQQKFDDEQSAHNTLKQTIEEKQGHEITAFLAPLEKTHKKEQIEAYKKIAKNSGLDTLKAVLGNSARSSVADIIIGKEVNSDVLQARKDWTWDKYQEEEPNALEQLRVQNIEAFKALFKARYNKEYIA